MTTGFVATLLGTIATNSGPVSIIQNSTQLVIFDGASGYLIPGGYPLTGGTVGTGGEEYEAGDTIKLQATDGQQNAKAVVQVSSVDAGGAVTGFSVATPGSFNPQSTMFTQQSTSGSGTGFTLMGATYGALVPIYQLSLPFTNPTSAAYQDGFGLVNQAGTNQWWQSDLNDLSYWDALNFSSADAEPDNIQALADVHEEVIIFKQTNCEVWVNAGLSGFAFQRLQGVHIEYGCGAVFSVAKAGDHLIWLSQNEQGVNEIRLLNGYEARKISTTAIDYAISQYPITSDAIGYAYQQGGHLFYVITFPAGNTTWTYDVTESATAGQPLWHQRAAFSNGQFLRHQSNCFVFFGGKSVVGDYRNGNLYALDTDALTDAGVQRKWLRSWRALQQPTFDPVTFESLQIDMQTGIGIPDGTNPQCMLRWSDDGGHTWSNYRIAAVGATGQTALRVKFNRLGSTRRNHGLDRYFELSSTDQFPVALIGANLE